MSRKDPISFLNKEIILEIQQTKLKAMLQYLNQNSPFYKKIFSQNNIDISSINTIEDLQKIPVTTKELLQQYNQDFLCIPKSKIIEYVSTSGTLGKPVTIALTENDLNRLAYNEYNTFSTIGANENDVIQLMLTLDRQFMAGLAYYSGIRKLGAGIIRLGPGAPSLQIDTIKDLKPTIIVAVPSFILKLISFAAEKGIDLNSTSIKSAVCIGENIRNKDATLNILGKKIIESWNISLFSTYASTEMQTAFTECSAFQGGHLQPELLILEMLDEKDQPVMPGEVGEVTITTLGIEGMPLLRYKTGDIAVFDEAPCTCGRNSGRLSSLIGRKKQMIKFKGTTIYPNSIFEILNEMEEIDEFIVEVSSNEWGNDQITLYLFLKQKTDEIDRKIRSNIQARLRVTPEIVYLSKEEISNMQMNEGGRKTIKFVDLRK